MRAGSRRADGGLVRLACVFAVLAGAAGTQPVAAQGTPAEMRVLRLESTPLGALPRLPPPMPANRDHHYWAFRVQAATRGGSGGFDLPAVAGGIDLQWRGGSVIGMTAGYQRRDCDLLGPDCGAHPMFEARARLNFLTGSSRIGEALGDYSSTTTVGTSIGFGYAPDAAPGMDACTLDLLVPVSLAMLQTVRLVVSSTPGVVWDVGCGSEPGTGSASYLAGLGIGLQQFGHPGLDFYLGVQKIFRAASGYQLGLTVSFTRLP
jgi:hypothetical protein